MKKFFKALDKILGITIILAVLAGALYIGFINPDLLKPTYTITLDANGGSVEQSEFSVKKGKTLELPELSREGYIFDGWYNGETLWTTDEKVSKDTELIAKWTAKKYTITFVVNGIEYAEEFAYDTTPSFTGDLTKTPTTTKEYTFSGWNPEITTVTGNATYTAQFSENVRIYNVSVSESYKNAGVYSGLGEFEYNKSTTVSVTPNTGYNFLGWYKNGAPFSTSTTIDISNITEDVSLEAQFSLINRTITYHDFHGTLANPTTYNVTNGIITLVPQNYNGYNFVGWFTEEKGNGERIKQIDSSLLQDHTLFAHYEIITYTISYNLNDGDLPGTNPTTYKITDVSFTLINPTKTDFEFIGWAGTGISGASTEVTIPNGSYGNREYTAIFVPLQVTITYQADGMDLVANTTVVNRGTTVSAPTINSSNYGMSGYSITNWYTDSSLTTPFDFSTAIKSDITLYGSWDYLLDIGFYAYKAEFDTARSTKTLTINSEDELVKWIEYISFYTISQTDKVTLTFNGVTASFNSLKSLDNFVTTIKNQSTYPTEHSISYGYSSNGTTYKLTSVFCSNEDGTTNGSLTLNTEKQGIYTQQDYALLKTSTGRGSEFSDFNINNVTKSIEVYSSNQLVYALSSGLNPQPTTGSPAETILNKAKEVLNSIISTDMTDLEKTRAIYDWLVTNVNYDHLSANTSASNPNWKWENYDSWYAEGVFNNGLAVCDGYAKAFIILAKLENIPAIRVTGNSHAWNKVYINGAWYGLDTTHGDLGVNNTEVVSYTNFLFTDAFKESKGYTATDYLHVCATTEFDYYDYETYSSFDLFIESTSEFEALIASVKTATKTTTYLTVEIKLEAEFGSSLSGNLDTLVASAHISGVNIVATATRHTDASGNTIYLLLIQ